MPILEYRGNIFDSPCQTLVNTVNCVGVMGRGVARAFKTRRPDMYDEYQSVCHRRALRPGMILPWRHGLPWILNFAVKDHWRTPSKMEWVDTCLAKFVLHYRRLGITSCAFPHLGCGNGQLPWDAVHAHMIRALEDVPIPIEIIEWDHRRSVMHDIAVLARRAHAILFEGAEPQHGARVQKTGGGLRYLTAQGFKLIEQNREKYYHRPGYVNWARMAREGHTVLQVLADGGPLRYAGVVVDGTYHAYVNRLERLPEFQAYVDTP